MERLLAIAHLAPKGKLVGSDCIKPNRLCIIDITPDMRQLLNSWLRPSDSYPLGIVSTARFRLVAGSERPIRLEQVR